MDLDKFETEIVLMQNELEKLEAFFTLYGNDIRYAESAVIFANETNTEFKIEWKRTQFSRYRSAALGRSDNFYSTRAYLYDDCDFVICCTPESVFGFLEKAIESTSSEILRKKYRMYRTKLEVYENANNH